MYYPKKLIKNLAVNTAGRDFVCGDIHGSFSCLEALLTGVNFDASKDRLICVGDLIDRGPENILCLHLLLEPWFHMVKGNHELLMETHFKEPNFQWWYPNGGLWGLRHKLDSDDESLFVRDITTEAIAELPLIITVDMTNGKKFHVIHAELPFWEIITDDDLADPERFSDFAMEQVPDGDTVQWGRSIFYDMINAQLDNRKIRKIRRGAKLNKLNTMFNDNLSHIYSGHSILRNPVCFYGQTGLDTGAYYSYKIDPPEWAGLTMTEPLTGRFWFANDRVFKETTPVVICDKDEEDEEDLIDKITGV